MTELSQASLTILAIALTFLVLVPWMFKLICVYSLHTIRDDLYDLGRCSEQLRKTRLYDDIEEILTTSIWLARDAGPEACLSYLGRAAVASNNAWRVERKASERAQAYRAEIAVICRTAAGQEQLTKMLGLFMRSKAVLALRVATCHPLAFILAVVVVAVYALRALVAVASASDVGSEDPGSKVARQYKLATSMQSGKGNLRASRAA